MALFDRLFKRQISKVLKGFSVNWLAGTPQAAVGRTYTQKVGDGMYCDVIMSPVLWAARRMAESPIGVRKVGDSAIDLTHPLAKLLKRPSPWYSGSAFYMALTIEYMTNGNAYSYKIRGARDEVVAEQFIPHWAINPHVPDNGFVDYYEYCATGVTSRGAGMVKLQPEDIVHLRNGIDPNNPVLGMSRLQILLREIYTDVEASEFTSMLLRNAGVMGVVISPKDGSSVISAGQNPEDVKKAIQEKWAGVRKGEPAVFTAPTDVQYVGVDAAKLDLSKLREIPEERVTALLGIPAAVVGFGTGLQQTKVGATMSEMRAMAYEDCIIPMQHAWADEWDVQLMPEFEAHPERFCVAFDLSAVRVLQDDDNKKSERLTRQFSAGGIMRSTYLSQLGYETTPDDDVYYISMATQIVPKALANGESTEPTATSSATDTPKALSSPAVKSAKAPANISRLMHRLAAERKRRVSTWTADLSKRFKAYGDRAGDLFEKIARERGVKAEPDYQLLGEIMDSELEKFDLGYEPHYLAIARDTYQSVKTILNLAVNLSDPAEARVISAGGTRKGLVDIVSQTREGIFQAIEQGRTAGEGAVGIANLIRDFVSAGPWGSAETRAMVIARTEGKYAQNISSLQAYKGGDNITGVQVFDAQLGPTDEECEMRNGRVVTFEVGERMVENEHPNGTISLAPYMGDLPADADEDAGAGWFGITRGEQIPDTKSSVTVNTAPVTVSIDNGGTRKRSVTISHADGSKSTAEITEELVNAEGNGNGHVQ